MTLKQLVEAPSGSLLLLGPALAQLKALSARSEGGDCACGTCKTCVTYKVCRTEKTKKKGCRCRACAERSTTHTGP